jgi:rhodanese-related sulfurtransferase
MPRNNRAARRKQTSSPGIPLFPWVWIGLGVVIVGVGIFLISKLSGSSTPSQISAAQAYGKYQAGAFILDVRTADEWNQGHIPGSILIPLDELSGRIGEVPRNREVVVVCRTGVRSAQGLAILRQAGYTRAASMTGGMLAWQAAGYPTTTNQ